MVYLVATVADELVNGKDGSRRHEEPLEERRLHKATTSVEDQKNVQANVEVVGQPESAEEIAARIGHGKDVDGNDNQHQEVSRHTFMGTQTYKHT